MSKIRNKRGGATASRAGLAGDWPAPLEWRVRADVADRRSKLDAKIKRQEARILEAKD